MALIDGLAPAPRGGGVTATVAVVGDVIVTVPGSARGFVISNTAPVRIAVNNTTTTLTVNDANFGYLGTGERYFTLQQGVQTRIHLSPETAVSTSYRIAWF